MIRIFYDAGRSAVFIDGLAMALTPRSLSSVRSGDVFEIWLGPVKRLAMGAFDLFADGAGAGFGNADAFAAYLAALFATPDGGAAEAYVVAEAAEAVTAGAPLYVDALGKFRLAQANTLNTSHVVAVAAQDAAASFVCNGARDSIQLADWSAIAGAVTLNPGARYFLDASAPGRISPQTPASPGQCAVVIGVAVSPTSLALDIGPPILL